MPSDKNDESEWYRKNYNQINASAITGGFYNKVLHTLLELPEKIYGKSNEEMSILEVGANNGEHISFVYPKWEKYLATDIRIPQPEVLNKMKKLGGCFEAADVQNLPFQSSGFDRVISTCVFHHLENPDIGFKEIRRVLKIGGSISILLPNDPGILYRLLWNMTTMRNAKKAGMVSQTRENHARQHRNNYSELMKVLKDNFKKDEMKIIGFPFIFQSYHMNVITVIYIKKIGE
jgi:phosphatidylethanolamine/phosphatidyl-N-methylethanolamine N-methyltransferase